MEIFSYVITHDSGFAPNPFGGILSLATCKPKIRKSANIKDCVVGTGSKSGIGNGMLVFAGIISEILELADYGNSTIFGFKIPKVRGDWWEKHGDNIYYLKNSEWVQRRNIHHGLKDMGHDLGGINVLLCRDYWYFGDSAVIIPDHLDAIVKRGPGHKRIKDKALVNYFLSWLEGFPKGINGRPYMEPLNKGFNRK